MQQNSFFLKLAMSSLPPYSHADVTDAIESLLLPLLTTVPSPELYNLHSTLHPSSSSSSSSLLVSPQSPLSTPGHLPTGHSRAVMEVLEYCGEKLPQLLPLRAVPLGDDGSGGAIVRKELVKWLKVSSQLSSAAEYHSYFYQRVWYCYKVIGRPGQCMGIWERGITDKQVRFLHNLQPESVCIVCVCETVFMVVRLALLNNTKICTDDWSIELYDDIQNGVSHQLPKSES